METLRFAYKPKAWAMALAGLFFAGCGVVLAKTALDNDRGLIINGIIRFETGEATGFYWALTGACVLFVLGAIFGVVRAMQAPQEVVLDAQAISAPKSGFSNTIVTVPYATITDLRVVQVKSQKMLTIHHRAGKLTLQRAMLPTHDDFEHIVDTLGARCRAARGL